MDFSGVYRWGLDLIRTIQRIDSPLLTGFMKGVTFLGSELVCLLIILFFYWCVDERKGIRLGLTIIIGVWVNILLKTLLEQPRPFHLDPAVGIVEELSYGLPSGHAQLSLTLYLILASWGKDRRFWLPGILLCLLIGFSRLYLGVHFHTDILAGWVLGILTLVIYFRFRAPLEGLLIRRGLRLQLICAAALALLMNALHPEDIRLGALALGLGGGYALMLRCAGFSASGDSTGRGIGRAAVPALRYLLGCLGCVVIHMGLSHILPREYSPYYRLLQFFHYLLLGFWVVCGAPWLFMRLKLARSREASPDTPA
jgi:membrane-associated phospholipid phosphatase